MYTAEPVPRAATTPVHVESLPLPARHSSWPDRLAASGIALFAVVRLLLLANSGFDKDEFQALHGGWNVAQGLLPFRDFWENHGPGTYYLLAPFFLGHSDGVAPFFLARGLMFLLCSLILWFTWRIGLSLFGRRTALLGVFLLATLDVFNQKMVEIRPDVPFVACWLASVWVWLGAKSRPRRYWFAGLLLGVGFAFTPKALFCLAAMACVMAMEARRSGARTVLAAWVRYFAGFLVPVVTIALAYAAAGAFRDLWQWTVVFNFTVPAAVRFWPGEVFSNWRDVGFWALATLGLVDAIVRSPRDGKAAPLLVFSVVLLLIYIIPMPQPYSQTFAAVLPFLALLAARPLSRLADKASDERLARTGRGFAPAGMVLVALCVMSLPLVPPWDETSPSFRATSEQKAQFAVRGRLLALTRSGETVLDGQSICVTRPQAYFFGSMVRILRCLHRTGAYPLAGMPDLPASLDHCHCKVMHMDRELREALDDGMVACLKARFVPVEVMPSAGGEADRGLPDGLYIGRAMARIDTPASASVAH